MWNHSGDDTAPAGSPKLPIPASRSPFQSFPLSIRSPPPSYEADGGAVWQVSKALLPSRWCSASKQPRQTRARVCCGLVYRSHSPWCYEIKHQLRHNSRIRNQVTDSGRSRHSTGLYNVIYETVSNKRRIRGRRITGVICRWFYACAPLANQRRRLAAR